MPRPQCPRCQRPSSHCLCALIPSLDNPTRILILQHPSEAGHALNTARLAALGLGRAELWIGEDFSRLGVRLATAARPALLFPGEGAETLAPDQATGQRPDLLIVPDGTWRKARKLLHMNPLLAEVPRVALPPGASSRYRLRKAPTDDALATIEAIVQALNLLDAPACFDDLLKPFEALIEGQIQAMGPAVYERNHGQRAKNR